MFINLQSYVKLNFEFDNEYLSSFKEHINMQEVCHGAS